MIRLGNRLLIATLSVVLMVGVSPDVSAGPGGDLSGAIKSSIDTAARWLSQQQNPDGGYGPYGEEGFRLKNTSDVGLTAIVLYALAKTPRKYKAIDGPFISKALKFLLSRQQSDGGFYDPKDPTLQNYKTSVVLLALTTLNRAKYVEPIRRAREFIKAQQMTEAQGYSPDEHAQFGGFGYGSSLRPDISNTQYSLEALAASGLSASDELWRKASLFVTRSLNSEKVDPLLNEAGVGTTGDGGARYGPNITRGPVETLDDGTQVFSSYGSMSYAALKSFLYANVDRKDPRVQGLFRWVSRNFSVRENPGMASAKNPRAGLHGLFYYYHTMSKALRLYGESVLVDADGKKHRWAEELATKLLQIQKPGGYWVNSSDRWWENIPELNTAYAIISLTECRAQIDEDAAKAKASAAPAKAPQEKSE